MRVYLKRWHRKAKHSASKGGAHRMRRLSSGADKVKQEDMDKLAQQNMEENQNQENQVSPIHSDLENWAWLLRNMYYSSFWMIVFFQFF